MNAKAKKAYIVTLCTYFDKTATPNTDVGFYSSDILGAFATEKDAVAYMRTMTSHGFYEVPGPTVSFMMGKQSKDTDGATKYELARIKEVTIGKPFIHYDIPSGLSAEEEPFEMKDAVYKDNDPTRFWFEESYRGVALTVADVASFFGMCRADFADKFIGPDLIEFEEVPVCKHTTIEAIFEYLDSAPESIWKNVMQKFDLYMESGSDFVPRAAYAFKGIVLSTSEVGDILGVTPQQICRWKREGYLTPDYTPIATKLGYSYLGSTIAAFCNTIRGRRYRAAWNHYMKELEVKRNA